MRNSGGIDQAEGLRRLLVPNQTQIITVVSGKAGVGCSSMVINLAAALARSGKDILVLDENRAPNNLLNNLALPARYDLLDVAQRRCALGDAVLTAKGFSVLPTARAMYALATLRADELKRLEDALNEAGDGADLMLVDAATLIGRSNTSAMSSGMANGAALLVVVDATASGITESYALIKRLATDNARLQFEIVVNKAVDERAAMTVFENMAKVARRNLAARLEYLGYVPNDNKLKRATQLGKSVLDAFPASAAAQSYLELSQKLLCLPMRQGEAENGISAIIQSLMRQVSQPLAAW
jgi:flagellar biosynthesis protein FlhG